MTPLSSLEVLDILSRIRQGESSRSIAELYGVEEQTIKDIESGDAYKSIPRKWLCLSGPMEGQAGLNYASFDEAMERLERAGYGVFSPAMQDREDGIDPLVPLSEQGFDIGKTLLHDLRLIAASDGVAVLPGFQDSKGATVEVLFAQRLGIPVQEVNTWILQAREERLMRS